jgi:hypothetical protein
MATKITVQMLDALGKGHSAEAVERLRGLLAEAGVTDVELHPYEINQAQSHRRAAARDIRLAEAIESRGPMPEEVIEDA